MCGEAGGRVSTNGVLRDMALDTVQADGRRFEVVVDGLPVFRGAPFANDVGVNVADVDGTALDEARRRKERTYPSCASSKIGRLGC